MCVWECEQPRPGLYSHMWNEGEIKLSMFPRTMLFHWPGLCAGVFWWLDVFLVQWTWRLAAVALQLVCCSQTSNNVTDWLITTHHRAGVELWFTWQKMCRLCICVCMSVRSINGLLWFVMTYSRLELLAASDEVLRESSNEWSYLATDLLAAAAHCVMNLCRKWKRNSSDRCYKHQPPLLWLVYWPLITRPPKRSWGSRCKTTLRWCLLLTVKS